MKTGALSLVLVAWLGPVAVAGQSEGLVRSILKTVEVPTGIVTVVHSEDVHFEAPNWSHDGRFFIVNSEGRLYRLSVDGSSAREEIPTGFATRLNNDHGISPDGRRLAVSHYLEEEAASDGQLWQTSTIYVLPIEGAQMPIRVTTESPSFWHGWSPDGEDLLYTALRDGEWDVYRIGVEGGSEERLTDCPGLDDGPEYDPSGEVIYYNSFCDGSMEIWRMRSDGSQAEQLTDDPYSNWFPHPSPDGRWLVFLSYLEDQGQAHPPGQEVKLRLMDLREGSVRDLTSSFVGGQGTINVPSWAPDSRRLAFVSYEIR